MNKKYFALISPPRTSSTSIRVWLDNFDGISCHGEILGPNNIHGTSKKVKKVFSVYTRNKQPKEFFEEYFNYIDSSTVGFKALTSHLLNRKNFAFLNMYFEQNPALVFIWRRNLVSRYISETKRRFLSNLLKPEQVRKITVDDIYGDCLDSITEFELVSNYWSRLSDKKIIINTEDDDRLNQHKIASVLNKKPEGSIKLLSTGAKNSSALTKLELECIQYLDELSHSEGLSDFKNRPCPISF